MIEALMCIALNVYHESRGEPIEGQRAVAHVTLNRAREKKQRVCDVVFAPAQFSWTIADPPIRDERAWKRALQVSRQALRAGPAADPTGGANHYHATYVSPRWAGSMERTAHIGTHVFYTTRINRVAMAPRNEKPS